MSLRALNRHATKVFPIEYDGWYEGITTRDYQPCQHKYHLTALFLYLSAQLSILYNTQIPTLSTPQHHPLKPIRNQFLEEHHRSRRSRIAMDNRPKEEFEDFVSHALRPLTIADKPRPASAPPTTTYVDSLLFVHKVQWALGDSHYNAFVAAFQKFGMKAADADGTATEIRHILVEANEMKLLNIFIERFLPNMEALLKSEEDVLKALTWTNLDKEKWEGMPELDD